ncbi:antifreeze protein [Athelia psychrophila]|uniref:Antifreeze protein n=1 Tax=Athelia psychrophila TaxID=1759441 RepID=A0A166P6H6_9AGAM|nr:antifreeze protein [Fibularhizoctonia sp. CBS 109695]
MSSFAIAILFLSNSCLAAGPLAVPLGTAANYAILAESGISTVPSSAITGNIGISPAPATAITGFTLALSPDGTYSTSTQITGKAYAASYGSPTPATLTLAVSDMVKAYNNASGRANPNFTNLATGNIGGLTLVPGLYKWTSSVSIGSSITISGLPTDTWIFQITGGLTIAHAQSVILVGGASPANIIWVVAGTVSLGTNSIFKGVVLGATSITMQTSSSINGLLLAQTAVSLQVATVTHS